jgi:L-rhamnose mutarotase
MKLYKVQDLGLPERWNNFTVFSSEVSRLILLSERGRTHGSIWGVPPFLEGVLRATVATTMTTSNFYSFIETTSYQTTYTVTVPLKQSRYSLMGEWWESDDGKNWRKVTSIWGRRAEEDCRRWWDYCNDMACSEYDCSRMSDGALPFDDPEVPRITYHSYNETLTLKASRGYTLEGRSKDCYFDSNIGECVIRYTEWGRTYTFQAIELVDWDTGELYASVNQTSITFNIVRNTIARYKYVLKESWSREWIVILEPPPPTPDRCQQILNDPSKVGSREWCSCLYIFDNEAWKRTPECQPESCYKVSFYICCLGTSSKDCATLSGGGGRVCKKIPEGATDTISVSWSISWSVMQGWKLDDIRRVGDGKCKRDSLTDSSASGTCSVIARPNTNYDAALLVIFKQA